jgi:hypothetical protein
MRIALFVLIGAVIAGLWARSAFAEKKRQEEEPPEINKHPERKEQMLDPTDDA